MNYLLSYEALPPEIKAQLTRITEAYFSEEGGTSYRLELANEILAYVLENARLFRLARFSPHPAIWTFWSL